MLFSAQFYRMSSEKLEEGCWKQTGGTPRKGCCKMCDNVNVQGSSPSLSVVGFAGKVVKRLGGADSSGRQRLWTPK
jgi:hypothetical protein